MFWIMFANLAMDFFRVNSAVFVVDFVYNELHDFQKLDQNSIFNDVIVTLLHNSRIITMQGIVIEFKMSLVYNTKFLDDGRLNDMQQYLDLFYDEQLLEKKFLNIDEFNN